MGRLGYVYFCVHSSHNEKTLNVANKCPLGQHQTSTLPLSSILLRWCLVVRASVGVVAALGLEAFSDI
jgi:hypothetical protein